MFKTAKTKIIGVALVGAVALGGAVYAASALAPGRADAATATTQAAQTTIGPELRATILEMLQSRMGITGPEAETFADRMIARMQSADPNFDVQAMIDWCTQARTDGTYGPGMMNGRGWGGGPGMMNGTATPGYGPCAPNGTSPGGPAPQTGPQSGPQTGPQTAPQNNGSGFRGMMGGGMMGAQGTR